MQQLFAWLCTHVWASYICIHEQISIVVYISPEVSMEVGVLYSVWNSLSVMVPCGGESAASVYVGGNLQSSQCWLRIVLVLLRAFKSKTLMWLWGFSLRRTTEALLSKAGIKSFIFIWQIRPLCSELLAVWCQAGWGTLHSTGCHVNAPLQAPHWNIPGKLT